MRLTDACLAPGTPNTAVVHIMYIAILIDAGTCICVHWPFWYDAYAYFCFVLGVCSWW